MRTVPLSPLLICIFLGAATGLSQASDVAAPTAETIYSDTVYASDQQDWTGFYAGFNLGYGLGSQTAVDITAFPNASGANFGSLAPEGWLGGVQAGANLQHGQMLFGIEADLQLGGIHGQTSGSAGGVTATTTVDMDWYGSLRPRLGVVAGPALIYATGGLAFGGLAGNIAAVGPAGETATLSTSGDVAWGYTAGGGVEYMLNDMISVRGEYQFTHLSAEATGSIYDAGGIDTGVDGSSTLNADVHAVKVGLNFHF